MHSEDLSDNPTLDSLETLIGAELLAKLSQDLGGRRLYIPAHPGQHSPIAVSIGLDAARKISDVYGGMEFHIPLRAGTRMLVLDLYRKKVPNAQIAVRLRISRRYVQRIINAEADDRQQDFFK